MYCEMVTAVGSANIHLLSRLSLMKQNIVLAMLPFAMCYLLKESLLNATYRTCQLAFY